MARSLRHALRWFADRLFPPHCQACGDPGANGLELCAPCTRSLPWHHDACPLCAAPLADDAGDLCFQCEECPPALDACWASLLYEDPIAGLLLRHKFHQDLAAGRLCAQLMQLNPPPWDVPVIAVIPLHRRRLCQRGYNQAAELARPMRLPQWHGLRRIRATAPQSERDADARRHNLEGAFAVEGPVPPSVVLLDDVMTTGSTLHMAAQALRSAGCGDVRAWVCARVPQRRPDRVTGSR